MGGSVTGVKNVSIGIRSPTGENILISNGRPWNSTLKAWGRSIGRFLRCSHVAVYNWIKAFGESIEGIRSASGVKIVEMDEMHTYIGSKKTSAGSGLLLIEMGSGLSTAYWAPEVQKQGRNYGKASKKKQSNP